MYHYQQQSAYVISIGDFGVKPPFRSVPIMSTVISFTVQYQEQYHRGYC